MYIQSFFSLPFIGIPGCVRSSVHFGGAGKQIHRNIEHRLCSQRTSESSCPCRYVNKGETGGPKERGWAWEWLVPWLQHCRMSWMPLPALPVPGERRAFFSWLWVVVLVIFLAQWVCAGVLPQRVSRLPVWFRIHVNGKVHKCLENYGNWGSEGGFAQEASGKAKNRWALLLPVELCGFYFCCC